MTGVEAVADTGAEDLAAGGAGHGVTLDVAALRMLGHMLGLLGGVAAVGAAEATDPA